MPRAGRDRVVLLGPIAAGKTTVGRLLAARLGCEFHSLDAHELRYSEAAGFDLAEARRRFAAGGYHAEYAYRRAFFARGVLAFLAEFQEGILELGGGHPVVPDPGEQARIADALRPLPNVVLLMPREDLEESLEILRGRLGPEAARVDPNRIFMGDGVLEGLARHTVLTDGRTPEEVCEAVLARIG